MSHGGELFALGEGVPDDAGFDVALRGYHRQQVDKYVANTEAEIAALTSERDEAYRQLQALANQVADLHRQMSDLRRHTAADAAVSFRHLGPRVEQILSLAEEQAEAIRDGAVADIERQRAEARRLQDEAREQANRAVRDFELALDSRRREEEQAAHERQVAAEAELKAAGDKARQILSEAEAMRTTAQEEIKGARAQIDEEYTARRAAMQQEHQSMRADAEQYATHVRGQAEAHAATVATQAEQHAPQLRGKAEQEAAQARAAGTAAADKLRADAERRLAEAQAEAQRHIAQARTEAEGL